MVSTTLLFIFLRFYLFILDRGEWKEKERETSMCGCLSHIPLTGNLACNPSMCPDWELNLRPLGLQSGAQPTEPHQPRPSTTFFFKKAVGLSTVSGDLVTCIRFLDCPRDPDKGTTLSVGGSGKRCMSGVLAEYKWY